jgi:hypothetical protein
MARKRAKHDTLNEIADELPNHTDSTGQLTSKEPRGFPYAADSLQSYHAAGVRPASEGDLRDRQGVQGDEGMKRRR